MKVAKIGAAQVENIAAIGPPKQREELVLVRGKGRGPQLQWNNILDQRDRGGVFEPVTGECSTPAGQE